MKQKKTIASKIVDGLIVSAMAFCIGIVLVIIIKSLSYWSTVFKTVQGIDAQMFWAGLLLAIMYTSYNVLIGFIKEIVTVLKPYN